MSTSRRSTISTITEAELNDLVFRLQALLPQHHSSSSCNTRVGTTKVLKETCNYIKKLHREVDGLSERISELLDSMEANGVDVDTLRNLLQH